MRLFSDDTCPQLPEAPQELKSKICQAPRDSKTHRSLMAGLPALFLMEDHWDGVSTEQLPRNLTIAAWNLERCIDPDASALLLKEHDPDIILLSEMDYGMARSGQRNTTADLASTIGMGYTFGVEFYELGLGSGPELELATDPTNEVGWHGNAIVAKVRPKRVLQIRLDDHGHWYCKSDDTDENQPRIGGRVAIAAIFATEQGDICTVSTHLESAGSISIRQSQIDRIIAAVDVFAPGLPTIIGGDLNTGNNLASRNWQDETLFEAAERHEFSWLGNEEGTTTRPSRLTRFPDRAMKLDWFCHRAVKDFTSTIVPAVDPSGSPLSDHELIVGRVSL